MKLSESVLATLAYHDIFDYPLTLEEIHRYSIKKQVRPITIRRELNHLLLSKKIFSKNGYFFLKGKESIVGKRIQRKRISVQKIKKALLFANVLKFNPFLRFVGITGALAMENSHRNDDIDLILITSKNCLWTTRFLSNIILLPFKRSPKSKKINNKACLNIFIDESNLKISTQNFYTAHEICQMKPLWEKEGTYRKFIKANQWIYKYLPNWVPNVERLTTNAKRSSKKALVLSRFALVVEPLEALAKWGQLNYMRSKITTEKIGETQLFFHPQDLQETILNEYKSKLKKFGIT